MLKQSTRDVNQRKATNVSQRVSRVILPNWLIIVLTCILDVMIFYSCNFEAKINRTNDREDCLHK